MRAWIAGIASSDYWEPDDQPGSLSELQPGQIAAEFHELQSGQLWFTSSASRASSNFFNTFFGVVSSFFSIFAQHADRISPGSMRCPLSLDHLLWVCGHNHGLHIAEQTGSQKMHRLSRLLYSFAWVVQMWDVFKSS